MMGELDLDAIQAELYDCTDSTSYPLVEQLLAEARTQRERIKRARRRLDKLSTKVDNRELTTADILDELGDVDDLLQGLDHLVQHRD